MTEFSNKVAAVTGAGSGIGQALALELARAGAILAISDVGSDGLSDTESQVLQAGGRVRSDRLDVTEREAVQGQGAYNAAKFAVRGFTEALRQEMAVAGHPVKVTCVHPGYIKTPLIKNMTPAQGLDGGALDSIVTKVAITSPQGAAKSILRAVAKNEARVLPGPDAKLFDLIVRATGSGYSACSCR